MSAMNLVGIGHFCIFVIYCEGAKITLRNELSSKGRDEMQKFKLNFAS